jgi:hypothetical protein
MKKKEPTKQTNFRLPESQIEKLKEIAANQGRTMSDLVVEMIQKEIAWYEEMMEFEKETIIPCAHCGKEISYYALKKGGQYCPDCGQKVRILRSPK